MIDVFIRHKSWDNLRWYMYEASCARWEMEPVRIITLPDLGIRENREFAEKQSQSDPYIFTDNDLLILGKDWVTRTTNILLAHPEYAIASTLSIVEGENQAKGQGEIYEMHAVGQPMLIRKGACVNLPPMDLNSECGALHKMVLGQGRKMGLIQGVEGMPLRHNHLGHGFSSNPALRWGY
jgi:hypothetical protein